MARKTMNPSKFEGDVSKELEEALDFDIVEDLDMEASMEDLEAQISQAADELVREGRAEAPQAEQSESPAGRAYTEPALRRQIDGPLRPVEQPANQSVTPAPANDDRQK